MATRDELIKGLEMVIQEGRRIGTDLSGDDWSLVEDLDGWKSKEVLAHVAGVGALVPGMVGGLANAPEGTNAAAGIDIDQLNAAIVAQRADKSIADLVNEIDSAYSGVITLVRDAPDDLLKKRITFAGYQNVPLSDIVVRMVILHGLAHIYSAYSRVMMSR